MNNHHQKTNPHRQQFMKVAVKRQQRRRLGGRRNNLLFQPEQPTLATEATTAVDGDGIAPSINGGNMNDNDNDDMNVSSFSTKSSSSPSFFLTQPKWSSPSSNIIQHLCCCCYYLFSQSTLMLGITIGLIFGISIATIVYSIGTGCSPTTNNIVNNILQQQEQQELIFGFLPTNLVLSTTTETTESAIGDKSKGTILSSVANNNTIIHGNDEDYGDEDDDDEVIAQQVLGGDLIAYVSLGPASAYPILKERLKQTIGHSNGDNDDESLLPYRFFYHSYDKDCDGCIFLYKSTYSEGKNLLLRHVIQHKDFLRFKYIAIFDEDVILWNKQHTPTKQLALRTHPTSINYGWKTFHIKLLSNETVHPIVKPQFWYTDHADYVDTYQSCTDEIFWAIRRDYLHVFFPYTTIHKEFFWLNAAISFIIIDRCYPAGILVLKDWCVCNPVHRYDTQHGAYTNPNLMLSYQKDALEGKFPQLSPWGLPTDHPSKMAQQRCTVKIHPSQGLHPKCSKYMKRLYKQWINGQYVP